MKLPGTRFKTNERKYFSQTAHREAVELVLQNAGDARGMDRFRKGHQVLLNTGANDRAVPRAGPGRVLGEYCSLLAVVSLCGSVSATSHCQLRLGNSLVLLQTKKATVMSSVFPAFTVKCNKTMNLLQRSIQHCRNLTKENS